MDMSEVMEQAEREGWGVAAPDLTPAGVQRLHMELQALYDIEEGATFEAEDLKHRLEIADARALIEAYEQGEITGKNQTERDRAEAVYLEDASFRRPLVEKLKDTQRESVTLRAQIRVLESLISSYRACLYAQRAPLA